MIYETSFSFLPTLASDELATQVGKLKEVITSKGGEIISEEYPQVINLAYSIRHRMDNKYKTHETAHFGWVKYDVEQSEAQDVKKGLDNIKVLLRYLTLKTVKENTMISKDVFAILQGKEIVAAPVRKVEKAPEPVVEGDMSEKKVDEQLDKMLDDESADKVEGEAKEDGKDQETASEEV
ncbi:MAG: ribosomal protein S6 [Candidatus Paceibacteria bacterium]|jgi:ribosomal protein S6